MNAAALSRNLIHPLATPTRAGDGSGGVPLGRVLLRRRGGCCPSLRPSTFQTRAAVEESCIREHTGSFYDLLGVPASGSPGEIKKAYKQLARKYHPDVSPPDRAEEYTRRFIEVHQAYETLSDPSRRALYDLDLARGLPLAFSARRRFVEELEQRSGWRDRWQDQLAELTRRSTDNDSEENLSWGARMRRQRAESSREEVPQVC